MVMVVIMLQWLKQLIETQASEFFEKKCESNNLPVEIFSNETRYDLSEKFFKRAGLNGTEAVFALPTQPSPLRILALLCPWMTS